MILASDIEDGISRWSIFSHRVRFGVGGRVVAPLFVCSVQSSQSEYRPSTRSAFTELPLKGKCRRDGLLNEKPLKFKVIQTTIDIESKRIKEFETHSDVILTSDTESVPEFRIVEHFIGKRHSIGRLKRMDNEKNGE